MSTPDTPCRVWRGTTSREGGYGQRSVPGHKNQRIHRWIVETAGEDQFGTPWDPALIVMHLCDNPPCFRFDHLKLTTMTENQADMATKGRSARGSRNGASRLTEEQVLAIRSATSTARELGERFGVSPRHINDIRSRRRWGWLTSKGNSDAPR